MILEFHWTKAQYQVQMCSVDRLIWKTSIYGKHFFFQALNDLVTNTHGKIIPPNQIQRLCRMTHALVGTILQ